MLITAIASTLGLVGAAMISKKNISGFYVWAVSDVIWVAYFGHTWTGLMFFLYLILSIYAVCKWKEKEA